MRPEDLAAWRLHVLGLQEPRFETPGAVVAWLGAVQSQDFGPAKWSVAARTSLCGEAGVDEAFSRGTILRTHVLRPTWHFVAPADIRWLLEVTGPRVHALNRTYYRKLELDDGVLARCHAVIAGALEQGAQRTRKELAARLEAAGIVASGPRLAYILMHTELQGLVCSGALAGRRQTYARLDERAPQARRLDAEEALAELTLRYFTSHGPATVKDFRSWSSLTLAAIREGLGMVETQLERLDVDGVRYWFTQPPPSSDEAAPQVHLLQGYDEYFMGYSESRLVVDVSGAARSLPAGTVVPNGVVVLDTQMAGHWRRRVRANEVVIETVLYAPFDPEQMQALREAADRHGAFVGLPAAVVSTVL